MPGLEQTKETQLIDSANAKLFTTIDPKQNAETIFLLHGGPGVPTDFQPLAEQLARKYQVIVFEQRGTGRSPAHGASYSIDEYIADINAIANHYTVQSFHLFGHSWGGLYAQIYAEKYPQKVLSLFLSSPSSGTGAVWQAVENEVMRFNQARAGFGGWLQMGIKSLLGRLGSDAAYQSLFKQVLKNYQKDFNPAFTVTDEMVKNVRATPINKTRPHIANYPLLKEGIDYPFPIIITYGQKDIYGQSKQAVKRRYPQATFVEIVQAGHIAWRDNPAMFNHILNNFYRIP